MRFNILGYYVYLTDLTSQNNQARCIRTPSTATSPVSHPQRRSAATGPLSLSLTLASHDHPDFVQSQGSFLYPSHPSHTLMLQPIPNLHSHSLTRYPSPLPTDIRPPPNPHSSFPSTPHPNPCYIPAPKKKTQPTSLHTRKTTALFARTLLLP